MNNFDSFDSNRRVHAICHVWKMVEWERSGDSICTKCSRETYILLLYGKILWIHSLFFSTQQRLECVVVWLRSGCYTPIALILSDCYTVLNEIVSLQLIHIRTGIYIFIFYLVNGWFWKALVCCYLEFINSHNNLSCMSWNSNNKLSKCKIIVGAFKEVIHINIVHE